jgi:hypothetical protein
VVALSPDDVWAVGTLMARTDADHQEPLIEHWDGRRWSVAQNAQFPIETDPEGEAIAAAAPNDIWILGLDYPVVNGGSISRDLYEHWDGSRWSLFEGPQVIDPAVGTAAVQVLSVDASGDVWAVGGKVRGFSEAGRIAGSLAERWDGSKWVEEPPPPGDAALSALAVAGPRDVWAVRGGGLRTDGSYGGGGREQFLHWNGSGWELSAPIDGTVNGMAANGPVGVWATGSTSDGGPLIEHWDGDAWLQVGEDAPGSVTTGLASVSIAPSGAVVAFGSDYPASFGGGYEGPGNGANNYLWTDCYPS